MKFFFVTACNHKLCLSILDGFKRFLAFFSSAFHTFLDESASWWKNIHAIGESCHFLKTWNCFFHFACGKCDVARLHNIYELHEYINSQKFSMLIMLIALYVVLCLTLYILYTVAYTGYLHFSSVFILNTFFLVDISLICCSSGSVCSWRLLKF